MFRCILSNTSVMCIGMWCSRYTCYMMQTTCFTYVLMDVFYLPAQRAWVSSLSVTNPWTPPPPAHSLPPLVSNYFSNHVYMIPSLSAFIANPWTPPLPPTFFRLCVSTCVSNRVFLDICRVRRCGLLLGQRVECVVANVAIGLLTIAQGCSASNTTAQLKLPLVFPRSRKASRKS